MKHADASSALHRGCCQHYNLVGKANDTALDKMVSKSLSLCRILLSLLLAPSLLRVRLPISGPRIRKRTIRGCKLPAMFGESRLRNFSRPVQLVPTPSNSKFLNGDVVRPKEEENDW